jgi:alpha-beta hydrolase superfamily lysophospholipase
MDWVRSPLGAPLAGLAVRCWSPAAPRASVLLIHGLAEHSGRYERLAHALNQAGYLVLALDLPGHGKSPGRRGHVAQFEDYLQPLEALLDRLLQWLPGLPRFALGHSLGGLLAVHLLLRRQADLNGAVLSGPALGSEQTPPAWQLSILQTLSWLWPSLGFLQLDASLISRDPQVVDAYNRDPLVYRGKISVRWINEAMRAMSTALQDAASLRLPLLLLHGEQDRLTTPEGSKRLFTSVSSTDKTLRLIPSAYHEVFNEPEGMELQRQLLRWLDERCPKS